MKLYQIVCACVILVASGSAGYRELFPTTTAKIIIQPEAEYSFKYAVNNLDTGDSKHQWEKKEGGVVRGSYTLREPDGSSRVVDYTADEHSGFRALVKQGMDFRHADIPMYDVVPSPQGIYYY